MLDYAANALAYWPASQIQSMFEQASSNRGEDPDLELSKFISEITDSEGSPLSSDSFWQSVEHNLKAGQSRMIFVGDAIPQELQRIVEFLNGQLTPAEVLAIEVRQYVGANARTLVPRVIGQTAQAQATKNVLSSLPWDRSRFLTTLASRVDAETAEIAGQLMEGLEQAGWTPCSWGRLIVLSSRSTASSWPTPQITVLSQQSSDTPEAKTPLLTSQS